MKCNTQLLFEHVFAFIVCRLRHYYQRMRIIILFALCRYAHSCAFISVIELPRIPAYCPKKLIVLEQENEELKRELRELFKTLDQMNQSLNRMIDHYILCKTEKAG